MTLATGDNMADRRMYRAIYCKDGFSMSVQASETSYCTPRENSATRYESVEVGFPSAEEPMLMEWAEDPHRPTDTVYAYVPVEVVNLVIAKHGGVTAGEAPAGVICLPAT